MPIKYDVDLEGAWLLPFAKKKLAQLKEQARDLGIEYALQRRILQIDADTRVEVSTVAGLDRITIRAGGVGIGFGVLAPAAEYFDKDGVTLGYRAQIVTHKEKTQTTLNIPYESLPEPIRVGGQIFFVAKDRLSVVVMRSSDKNGAPIRTYSERVSGASFSGQLSALRIRNGVATALGVFNDGNGWGTTDAPIPGSPLAPTYTVGPIAWNYEATRFVFFGNNVNGASGSPDQPFRYFIDIEDTGVSARYEITDGGVTRGSAEMPLVSPNAKYAAFYASERIPFEGYPATHTRYVGIMNLDTGVVTRVELTTGVAVGSPDTVNDGYVVVSPPQITVTDDGVCWIATVVRPADSAALEARVYKNNTLVYTRVFAAGEVNNEVVTSRKKLGGSTIENGDGNPNSVVGELSQAWSDTSLDGSVFACTFLFVRNSDLKAVFQRVIVRGTAVTAYESVNSYVGLSDTSQIRENAMPHPDSSVMEVCFLTNCKYLAVANATELRVYDQVIAPPANNSGFAPSQSSRTTGLSGGIMYRNYDRANALSVYIGSGPEEWQLKMDPKPLLETGAVDTSAPDEWSFERIQVASAARSYYSAWPAASTAGRPMRLFGVYPQFAPL